GALAAYSRHPYSRALSRASSGMAIPALTEIAERPGFGVEAMLEGARYRLGRADWALNATEQATGTVLSRAGSELARFTFRDDLRPGAREAVAALRNAGLTLEIVSGDTDAAGAAIAGDLQSERHPGSTIPGGKAGRIASLRDAPRRSTCPDDLPPGARAAVAALRNAGRTLDIVSGDTDAAVAAIADDLQIERHQGSTIPGGKAERIASLRDAGHKTLMVGDGLNDAPAL